MAGTRCANPEYQVEVDTMMVEYLLYKSIDANLQFLTTLSQQQKANDLRYARILTGQADSVLRLAEMYDVSITLYKRNHGECLSENTTRNGRILRFLVELNSWVRSSVSGPEHLTLDISPSMRDDLRRDMTVNQTMRRMWLAAYRSSHVSPNVDGEGSWRSQISRLCLTDHLLPSFMWISMDLFRISKMPQLGREWMVLAASLMVQAAIEILEAPDLLARGPRFARDALEECCAWGYLKGYRFESSMEDMINHPAAEPSVVSTYTTAFQNAANLEDRCQDMFRSQSKEPQNSNSGSHSSGDELSTWTEIRQEALHDILMTFTSIQEVETEDFHRPIALLRDKYRLTTLLRDVANFITIHWRLLHSSLSHGKPILVQIEDGGIDGLSARDFEDFKDKARIRDMWDSALLSED